MRRTAKHGNQPASAQTPLSAEAEFSFGYFYRSIEDHVNAYAAQNGDAHTFSSVASRVARLLEAASVREQFRDSELVSEVWQVSARTGVRGAAGSDKALHVRARGKRTLNAAAIKAISDAQVLRWAKTRLAQGKELTKAQEQALAREKGGKRGPAQPKKYAGPGALTPAARKRGASALKKYWAMMTPMQRSAEMKRRQELAAKKKAVARAA